MMIGRVIEQKILAAASKMPVVAVTGPRQSGKSTLIRALFPDYTYTDLEDPEQRAFAIDDPRGFLLSAGERVIIDEVQYAPSLLSYIQIETDKREIPGQFILCGSQNLLLMESISQSLAGRVALFHLLPFSLEEIAETAYAMPLYEEYIVKGFYPRIYKMQLHPTEWLLDYIQTYVERDLRQLLNVKDLGAFRQFLELCAGRIGHLINFSDLGSHIGISYQTIKHWLSILETSFIIHTLRPFHKNYNKRITKSPKLYFYDTGLACALMNIKSVEDLNRHFAKGQLFENLIVNEILKNQVNRNIYPRNYFWRASGSHEIDVILDLGGTDIFALEVKSTRTINTHLFDSLKYFREISGCPPEHCYLVYGGDEVQRRRDGQVLSWRHLDQLPLQ